VDQKRIDIIHQPQVSHSKLLLQQRLSIARSLIQPSGQSELSACVIGFYSSGSKRCKEDKQLSSSLAMPCRMMPNLLRSYYRTVHVSETQIENKETRS